MSTVPLGIIATISPSNVDKKSVDGEARVRLVNYTDVYYNQSIEADQVFMTATAPRAQIERLRLRPGDVIITKDSESPDDIGIPAYVASATEDMVCGYHLSLIRPRPDVLNSAYLYWILRSSDAAAYWLNSANGVTRYSINSGPVERFPVRMVDLQSQRRIADYLSTETAEMDTMERQLDELVVTLHERRRAAISEMLTGIEAVPIGLVCRTHSGGTPSTNDASFWSKSEGTPWVTISDISQVERVKETNKRLTPSGLAASRLRVGDPGTVLFAMYASVGETAILDIPAVWNQAIVGLVPSVPSKLDNRFLYLAVSSLKSSLPSLFRSNTQNNLNAEQVKSLRIPFPTLAEQHHIVSSLEKRDESVKAMIADALRLKELIVERRNALITEVVTGRKEV